MSNEIYSDLMNQYIKETGKPVQNGWDGTIMPDYVFWLESKATAYDRLMSGDSTLKELANILRLALVVHSGILYASRSIPKWIEWDDSYTDKHTACWDGRFKFSMEVSDKFEADVVTLPDGWEANK